MGHVGGKGDLEVVAGEGVNVFEVKLLFLLADVDFGEEEFKLSSEFTNDLQSFEILIFFDDDVLVLLVEEADCFLLVGRLSGRSSLPQVLSWGGGLRLQYVILG